MQNASICPDSSQAIKIGRVCVSVCPVPPEQRPINEYQELKESWFFSWVLLEWPRYLGKLLWIWGGSWL
ncbi:MAG: CGLD27 family protein, partial [Microcoleaceae cyanobacterium]